MAGSFKLEGVEKFVMRLNQELEARRRAVENELYHIGEEIMADSKANYVPVDTGALRSSGNVQWEVVGDHFTVYLIYGGPAAPYAIYVHENLTAHHPVGQAKYLEIPLRAAQSHITARLTRAARSVRI